MKKFCNKLTKQQWRVTVPNITPTTLFRRSPSQLDSTLDVESKSNRASSGSYDLIAAQKDYDVANPVPRSVLVDTDSSSDDDDDDETEDTFEDAPEDFNTTTTATAEDNTVQVKETRLSSCDGSDDNHLYTEVHKTTTTNAIQIVSKTLTEANNKYEYDVPKICFSFFESFTGAHVAKDEDTCTSDDYEVVNVKGDRSRRRSEIKLTLKQPEHQQQQRDSTVTSTSSNSNQDIFYSNQDMSGSPVTVPDVKKCDSVPNVHSTSLQLAEDEGGDDEEAEGEDNFYKVPKPARLYRLSKSLHDFQLEHVNEVSSTQSSIEHISCSQVIVQTPSPHLEPRQSIESETSTALNPASLEYCKARSKLPRKIRRVTLLRRPRNKAADTWSTLKTKLNKMLEEHSSSGGGSTQPEHTAKVANFGEKERMMINIEEMYKNSREKCKRMLQSTGRMFKHQNERRLQRLSRVDQENVDPNAGEGGSKFVKNDAFFAKVECKSSPDVTAHGEELRKNSETPSECVTSEVSESGGSRQCRSPDSERREEFDFGTLKSAFKRSRYCLVEGQNGFDDLRRYVKQGGDFCKELSVILQERSDAELQYAKSLAKLSGKLTRACRDGVGDLNAAWRRVAGELETRAEAHRLVGTALLEEIARPLRTVTDSQHRERKRAEAAVEKSGRGLGEWRAAEAKGKKQSHGCARENEKLQDVLLENRLSRSTSLIQLPHIQKNSSDKETAKLEGKKRKAEDAVKKADIEYYTLCVRAERARLEWESAVLRGAGTFQTLEDERLANLKSILNAYFKHCMDLGPRIIEATERLKIPVDIAEPAKDLSTFITLRQSSQQISEQLLPDFYCEHITLAMNRERRKQALIKLLHLIRQDIERERKSKAGLENLSKAIKQTPNFGAEDSQQSVTEKLYHMKSMLTYLEGARYKVQSALAELDSRPRIGHPLAPHISITRDKSGLQQSILKVPQWLRDQWTETEKSPVSEKSDKCSVIDHREIDLTDTDWTDRGTADGNSNQPDSDFDEFSSQASSTASSVCHTTGGNHYDRDDEDNHINDHHHHEHKDPPTPPTSPPPSLNGTGTTVMKPVAHCKALYAYTPNLPDELPLRPGDMLSVYRQQEDGWWLGECNGSVGIFPATYVETIAAS